MLSIRDETMLYEYEKSLEREPVPKKILADGRIVYESSTLPLPKKNLWGWPVLCDFGEARIGKLHRGTIQPQLYRAPEVLFSMDWTHKVDIWNLGVLVSQKAPTGFHGLTN